MKYSPCFNNIYKITVTMSEKEELLDNFDFKIFNNIKIVTLRGFNGITQIVDGFENVRELQIIRFNDLISIDCPLFDLDNLQIIACDQLISIPKAQKIKQVGIGPHDNFPLTAISPTLFNKTETLYLFQPDRFMKIQDIPYQSLQRLFLRIEAKSSDDFSVLANIPSILIENTNTETFPFFPIFHGKHLDLTGFDLLQWYPERNRYPVIVMENLRVLNLSYCRNWCNFQPLIFLNVRYVLFEYMHGIESLLPISFPNCINLYLLGCQRIKCLYRFKRLRRLEVVRCNNLKEFIGFIDNDPKTNYVILSTVRLKEISIEKNIAWFRNIPELILENCQIESFDGFDQTDYPDRKVTIHQFDADNLCDMKGLGNIGTLELMHVSNLKYGKGIHDIDHLILRGMPSLYGFDYCYRIKKSIIIYHAQDLQSIKGLQFIPNIAFLWNCENYTHWLENVDHNVLKGCDHFACHESFPWAIEGEKYLKDYTSTPLADVYDRIKHFSVVPVDFDVNYDATKDFSEQRFYWDVITKKIRLW